MKQEVYEMHEKFFTITDEELGIHLTGILEKQVLTTEENSQQECYYSAGQLHGPSKYFTKEGNLLSLTWFYQGKKEGKLLRYYQSGQLYCIERYLEGNPHLTQEYFYREGQKKTLIQYDHGKYHGKIQLFWPHGILKRECIFISGVKIGCDKMYDEQGNLVVLNKSSKNFL